MKLDITQKHQNITLKESIDECTEIVSQDFTSKITDKDKITKTLLDLIDSIYLNDNAILLKLNKSLMIQTENLVFAAENLNIQLAGRRVELQPRISKPKKIENSNLSIDSK